MVFLHRRSPVQDTVAFLDFRPARITNTVEENTGSRLEAASSSRGGAKSYRRFYSSECELRPAARFTSVSAIGHCSCERRQILVEHPPKLISGKGSSSWPAGVAGCSCPETGN